MQIKIKSGALSWTAVLFDTPTGRLIRSALPIKGKANRWGGEIYFSIPVSAPLEPEARDLLSPGDLGYWPTGSCFCIFFGATPAGRGGEIRAASAVNVFGRIEGDTGTLNQVPDGADVFISRE